VELHVEVEDLRYTLLDLYVENWYIVICTFSPDTCPCNVIICLSHVCRRQCQNCEDELQMVKRNESRPEKELERQKQLAEVISQNETLQLQVRKAEQNNKVWPCLETELNWHGHWELLVSCFFDLNSPSIIYEAPTCLENIVHLG
jgi:hypothetical protein